MAKGGSSFVPVPAVPHAPWPQAVPPELKHRPATPTVHPRGALTQRHRTGAVCLVPRLRLCPRQRGEKLLGVTTSCWSESCLRPGSRQVAGRGSAVPSAGEAGGPGCGHAGWGPCRQASGLLLTGPCTQPADGLRPGRVRSPCKGTSLSGCLAREGSRVGPRGPRVQLGSRSCSVAASWRTSPETV